MHARWLLGVLLVGACAARTPALSIVPQAGEQDSLDLQFAAIRTTASQQGLTPGALLQRGFLPPGGRAAYPIAIAAKQCALFVALATASMVDLDASLYTSEGVPLIEDDSASSRPSLTFCAGDAPVTGYLTLHAYQGAGSFVAAQFARGAGPDDDLRTTGADGLLSPLGQLAQRLHERGFEDAAPRVSVPLEDARPVRLALNVTAGECYTMAAEGHEGLMQVAIRLVDAEGGELAYGMGEPALAAVQYCASERAELALEVSARRGQGVARVARFRATQAQIGGARALWLGEPTPSPEAWASAKGADGPRAPTTVRAWPLRQGEVRQLPPERAQAACEQFELRLEPGLARATLRIESERGALLGETDTARMYGCMVVCAPPGTRHLTLIGRSGFGRATLARRPVDARAQGSAGRASACSP